MSDEHNYPLNFETNQTPAGSLKVNIQNEEYIVRVMKPSNGATLNELQLSLTRNREMLKESYLAMHEACRDDILKRVEKKYVDHFSPTQNALVARANIDLLIPLINVKGGIASYKGKLEGLPIERHISKLRSKAIDNIREEGTKTRIGSFFIIMGVIVLTALILLFFF